MTSSTSPDTFWARIVAQKRREVADRRAHVPADDLELLLSTARPLRPLLAMLEHGQTRIIAEVKRGSPSRGLFAPQLDATAQATLYATGGAVAVSVLTDGPFFYGSLDDLRAVASAIPLPVLRKDFLLDRYQLLEARLAGADIILLIVAMLTDSELATLLAEARDLGLQPLVEVHTIDEVKRALAAGADLVGINNRDLATFVVDLTTTERLLAHLPATCTIVSESGIDHPSAIARLRAWGVHAALVGEALVRSATGADLLHDLVAAGRGEA